MFKKGVTYTIDGEAIEFKNDYVVDYAKNEYTVLSGRAVNWNENSTLAVTDGLVLNVDPMSLADGEWVNNETGKTYEEELENAEAIVDEEARTAELNKVRNENFYNFWVQNLITEEWTNTGTQKSGDVEYNSEIKALKLNKDEINNADGEGGYLKLMKSGVDFSDGFTFELYFSPDRFGYEGPSGNGALYEGFFSRTSSLTSEDFTSALRLGVATIGNMRNNVFLKGDVYSTRLYAQPMISAQVKDNYDMTLKYRSSF